MWVIVGTVPDAAFSLTRGDFSVDGDTLVLHGGVRLSVERGTAALAAAAWLACRALDAEPPQVLLAGDAGRGDGSRSVYRHLVGHVAELRPAGLTFHYLFPDVDWHNRVLMAVETLEPRPVLVADAGFMYVAKMSGYADAYDLFTPDAGELAFLADEQAPHPFYTRGFLLETGEDVPALIRRARSHGNCARQMIVKGSVDYIVSGDELCGMVDTPSVRAMEAVGGTGDLVTGLATGFLAAGLPMVEACLRAVRVNRQAALSARPTPATQVGELLPWVEQAVRESI